MSNDEFFLRHFCGVCLANHHDHYYKLYVTAENTVEQLSQQKSTHPNLSRPTPRPNNLELYTTGLQVITNDCLLNTSVSFS